MPHLIVEYSTNLEPLVDIGQLVEDLHAAALSTGVAPLDALRTRAEPRSIYRIGDGRSENSFVAITARLGPGRTIEQKHLLLTVVFEALERSLGAAASNAMLSIEYQEIDAEFRVNKNNARVAILARQKPNADR